MTTISSPLSDESRTVVGHALQDALVDLIDLSLLGKQAHWNVVGRNFRSLHLQLDEVVSSARTYADQVAERAAALGVNPDGRAATVSEATPLPQLKVEWLADEDVVDAFIDVLELIGARLRARLAEVEEHDPITQDLLIEVTEEIEKHRWMFAASR
jgi:starvation-inducible DNA-binding protein